MIHTLRQKEAAQIRKRQFEAGHDLIKLRIYSVYLVLESNPSLFLHVLFYTAGHK